MGKSGSSRSSARNEVADDASRNPFDVSPVDESGNRREGRLTELLGLPGWVQLAPILAFLVFAALYIATLMPSVAGGTVVNSRRPR